MGIISTLGKLKLIEIPLEKRTMKAISEFKYSVQNPTGDEWLIVNKQEGSGYKSYKVKLSDIKAFIDEKNEETTHTVRFFRTGQLDDQIASINVEHGQTIPASLIPSLTDSSHPDPFLVRNAGD